MKKGSTLAILGCLIMSAYVWAQAPNLVNYQGVLKDSGGNPLTGTYSITFSLYSVSSGGTALWTETQGSVSVSNGLFSVLLGSVTPLTPSEFSGTDRWLGVTVGGDPEMTPRQRIASVPFALKAPPTAPTTRTIHTGDPVSGCPPSRAANTDLFTQAFTLSGTTYVYITADIIRRASGRVDLQLYVDGTLLDRTLTYTSSTQWEDAHVVWTGTLVAGAHTVSLRSPTANVWGCGSGWGAIDTIIFD
jgi:hypothetical protein